MRRRRSRETTGRERSRLFFCCCCRVRALHQFDATAAGMNLKQFNYSTRRVNCLLVEKRHLAWSQTPPKKKRKREKKRRERGRIFCVTQVHTITKMFLRASTNRRPEEEARQSFTREREKTFLFFYDAEKGKRKTKERARVLFLFFLERERERRGILSSSSSSR